MSSLLHKKKCRIVFLGNRPVGKTVLEWLVARPDFDVVGVLLYPKDGERYWREDPRDIAEEHGLRELGLQDLPEVGFDVGLSVNYHKKIDAETLALPILGFWNVHHSYNLRLKGRNITTHAILLSRKENYRYHGSTLHRMVEEIDCGPIAASRTFPIEDSDTAVTLFDKANEVAFELIKEWLPRIAYQQVITYDPPAEGFHKFLKKDLPSKQIEPDWTADEIHDHVRAFEFPPFPPAFMQQHDKVLELSLSPREGFDDRLSIKGFEYYVRNSTTTLKE